MTMRFDGFRIKALIFGAWPFIPKAQRLTAVQEAPSRRITMRCQRLSLDASTSGKSGRTAPAPPEFSKVNIANPHANSRQNDPVKYIAPPRPEASFPDGAGQETPETRRTSPGTRNGCRKSRQSRVSGHLGTHVLLRTALQEEILAVEGTKRVSKMYTRLRRRDNRFIQLPQYMLVS